MKRADVVRFETYPGLESYQDNLNSRKLYFGRELEQQALLDLVIGEPLAVLFSRSGLGKSSLINAGLKQPLRDRGYFPAVARLTLLKDPVKSVIFAIGIEAALADVTVKGADDSGSLWQYLNSARFERAGNPCKLVLILDQFEELFTRVREANPDSEEPFIDDLANVVRRRLPAEVRKARTRELEQADEVLEAAKSFGDETQLKKCQERRSELVHLLYEAAAPDVKVLIAIREDYLADLERLREPMPAIFHKMMRLDPLTPEQARQSIERPAARADIPGKEVFSFEEKAVNQIIEFLQKRTNERRPSSGGAIDPGQLQLICQNVDVHRRGNVVTADELGGEKGMQRILQRFYRDTLRVIPKLRIGRNAQKWRVTRTNFIVVNRARGAARRLCEHGLISRGGHRDSIMRETIHSRFGVIDDDLKTLEGKKLVRSTQRLERDFFELSHDTLVKPVLASVSDRRVAYFVAAYLLACTIPFGLDYFKDVRTAYENRKFAAQVRSGQNDFSNRNLANREISRVTWQGGRLVQSSLRGAVFDRVTFQNVNFDAADVSHTKFDGSNFLRCRMTFEGAAPSFAGTTIDLSDLTGAKIPLADFSHAEVRDTKLIRAVLDGAKFVGTNLEHVRVAEASVEDADFTGTPWWAASGWSDAQMRELSARFPPKDIVKSKQYRDDLTKFERRLATEKRTDPRFIYADRAWYRTIRGAELDAAIADAGQVLEVHDEDAPVLDTRAYARLQKGDVAGALADAMKAVAVERREGVKPVEDLYHLALAELAAGKAADAEAHFREATANGYTPSYELVLTPPLALQRRSRLSPMTTAK